MLHYFLYRKKCIQLCLIKLVKSLANKKLILKARISRWHMNVTYIYYWFIFQSQCFSFILQTFLYHIFMVSSFFFVYLKHTCTTNNFIEKCKVDQTFHRQLHLFFFGYIIVVACVIDSLLFKIKHSYIDTFSWILYVCDLFDLDWI